MASFIKKWRKKAIAMYGKARGLTKAQRDNVTAAAHRRSSSKTSKRSKTKRTKKVRRLVRRYRRRRGRRRGGKNTTATLYKLVRLGALVAPAAYQMTRSIPTEDKIRGIVQAYTGYNWTEGNWHAHRLLEGWGPYLGAVVTTYGIPKIAGIIRRL